MQNAKCKFFEKSAISLLKESVDEVPSNKSSEFSDEHKECRRKKFCAVEAEGYGDDITNKRYPREECHPRTIFIDLRLLLGEGFGLHAELFNPLPLADAAYAVGG